MPSSFCASVSWPWANLQTRRFCDSVANIPGVFSRPRGRPHIRIRPWSYIFSTHRELHPSLVALSSWHSWGRWASIVAAGFTNVFAPPCRLWMRPAVQRLQTVLLRSQSFLQHFPLRGMYRPPTVVTRFTWANLPSVLSPSHRVLALLSTEAQN